MATRWEYKAWFVLDDINQVNDLMAQWAEAGWELINGSVTSYVEGYNTLRVHYTQYWRKAINE